jgi:light-regulated signal transduction histidine kinase (bacteriophytochrome)
MTDCILRSVSSIHIQCLNNMNVSASMSVSIVRDGTLWGLVACPYTAPKLISCEVSEVCKHGAQILSQQIAAREEAETFHPVRTLTAAWQELVPEIRHREPSTRHRARPQIAEVASLRWGSASMRGVVTAAGHHPGHA